MLTRETAIKIANCFINDLVNSGISLKKAILFGSFASNTQNNNSDIDIALFSPIFTGFGFEDKKLFAKWNIKPSYINIDVKTYPNSNDDPFIEIIEKTGIPIFSTK